MKLIKQVISQFPKKEKFKLLRNLEKELFSQRLSTLLKDLKDVPLSYEEINEEVEYVRAQRHTKRKQLEM